MYVLVTYDVSTTDAHGKRRLRNVAKVCLDFGQRVQNSVFEMKVDPAQWATFKERLREIVDLEQDSIRFYFLGKNWEKKVEHLGVETSYNVDGPLIA